MNAATKILSLLIMDFEELEENNTEVRRKTTIARLEHLAAHLQDGGEPPDFSGALSDAGYSYDGVHIYS